MGACQRVPVCVWYISFSKPLDGGRFKQVTIAHTHTHTTTQPHNTHTHNHTHTPTHTHTHTHTLWEVYKARLIKSRLTQRYICADSRLVLECVSTHVSGL